MKKLLLPIFLFITVASFGQATQRRLGIDSASGNVKGYIDTIVVAPYISNYFLNGFARFQKFDSTARLALSMDTAASAYSYDNTTGIIHIHPGSGGGSSTVQLDSSFLIATTHTTITTPKSYKGLLVRDTNAAVGTGGTYYTPRLLMQEKHGATQQWFSIYGSENQSTLHFEFSSDSINYTQLFTANSGGSITNTGGLVFGGGTVTGTKIAFGGVGYGSVGISSPVAPNIFQVTPGWSPTTWYAIGLPQMSVTNRTNYPGKILTGAISSGGSGYTNGTYNNKSFVNISGVGTGGLCNVTVSGGSVTSVTPGGSTGNYRAGDTLTVAAANIGGTGSGFTWIVSTTQGDGYNGSFYYDSTLDKLVYWKGHSHVNAPLVDSASALLGVTNGVNALAGNIGQVILGSGQSTYTNYTTSATYQALDSITLTAGDWDLIVNYTISANSATIVTTANAIFAISTTVASASGTTEGLGDINYIDENFSGSSKQSGIIHIRKNISTSTKYYLNSQSSFTVGNPQYVCSMRGERMR